MQRTRDYYLALGYDNPYEWAHFDEVPFTPLARPLAETTIALVTTAAPLKPDAGDQGPGAPYNAAAKFYDVYEVPIAPTPDLRISHVAIDRVHTTAEDPGAYLPAGALLAAHDKVVPSIFGLPTNRSRRKTHEDAEDLTRRALAKGTGAAVLVPNCPVCHQSVSIAARVMEAAGISTVIMGCAKDIVEHAGVPRFLFSDFPLGNSAGRPNDTASQAETLGLALSLLESATDPRTTVVSPLKWPGPADWREDYSNPDRLSSVELARRRAEFDAGKAAARGLRKASDGAL